MKRPRRRSPRRRRALWPLLGLGAVGLAAVWLGRRAARRTPHDSRRSGGGTSKATGRELAFAPPPGSDVAWIPGPGGSLRVLERHPNGQLAIVFVHGLGGRLEQWAPLLSRLGPGIRSLAVDLPGHGGSDSTADGGYSVPALAAALAAVAEGLRLRRMVLAAHSLGASVALEYAARHPERVDGVLLVDPNGDQTRVLEEERLSFLEILRRDPAREFPWYFQQILQGARPEVRRQVLASLDATGDEVLLGCLEGVAEHSPVEALERYGGPVLSLVSEWNALPQSLHRLQPALPVRHLYGASHWLMMDRPAEVAEVLWDFLEDTR